MHYIMYYTYNYMGAPGTAMSATHSTVVNPTYFDAHIFVLSVLHFCHVLGSNSVIILCTYFAYALHLLYHLPTPAVF